MPKISTASLAFNVVWKTASIWITAKDVQNFHNNWTYLDGIIRKTPKEFSGRGRILFSYFAIVVPSFLFLITHILTPGSHLMQISATASMISGHCGEKINTLLVYSCLSEGFHYVYDEIRNQVAAAQTAERSRRKNLNSFQLHKWKRAVLFVRNQTELASNFLFYSEAVELLVFSICYVVSIATLIAAYAGETICNPIIAKASAFTAANVVFGLILFQYFVSCIYTEVKTHPE